MGKIELNFETKTESEISFNVKENQIEVKSVGEFWEVKKRNEMMKYKTNNQTNNWIFKRIVTRFIVLTTFFILYFLLYKYYTHTHTASIYKQDAIVWTWTS